MKSSRLPSFLLLFLTVLPAVGLLVIGLTAWDAAADRAILEARDASLTVGRSISGHATALLAEADLAADSIRTDRPPPDSPIREVFVASADHEILLPHLIRFPSAGPLPAEDGDRVRKFLQVVDDTKDPVSAALFLESGVPDFVGTDLPGYLLYIAARKYREADLLERARLLLLDVVSTFPGARNLEGRAVGPLAQLGLIDVLAKLGDRAAAAAEIRRLADRLADHAYDLPSVERDVMLRRAGELFADEVLPEAVAERAALVDSLRSRVVPEAVATLSAADAGDWRHVVLVSRTGTEVFGWKSLDLDSRPHVFGYRLSREWFRRSLMLEATVLAERHGAVIRIGLLPELLVTAGENRGEIVERMSLHGPFRNIDVEIRLPPPGGLGILRVLTIVMSLGLAAALITGVLLSGRAVRRELEAARLKQEFIDNVSHELRTPLTSIRMYAEMLAEENALPEDKRAEYLRWVLRESERLSLLVDDVLDFARLSRGAGTKPDQPVDPGDLVREAVALARPLADREGFDLAVEMPPSPPRVRAEKGSATRALVNLITNAVRHASSGGGARIAVVVEQDRVRFTVTDRGPGIPEKARAHLFDRFYRAPGGAPGGIGIGLVLAREIARTQDGDIVLEKSGPDGSRFALILPVAKEERS